MKRNAIVRIILFSLIALVLTGILIGGLALDSLPTFIFNFNDDLPSGTVSSAGSVDAAAVSNIDIDWAAGNIRIQTGDVKEITFSETAVNDDSQKMVWKQTGNTLSLQFNKGNISFSSFGYTSNGSKDLVITVPKGWQCGELSIDVASADVEVKDMAIREVDFDGASGKCDFRNCSVDELSVDTASGNIQFTGTLNVLDCDAASADCTVTVTNVPRLIELDTASGDLTVTLPEDAGFRVSIDSLSSHFDSDFPTTMSGGDYLFGDGSCRIVVDAMSGRIAIRKGQATSNGTF